MGAERDCQIGLVWDGAGSFPGAGELPRGFAFNSEPPHVGHIFTEHGLRCFGNFVDTLFEHGEPTVASIKAAEDGMNKLKSSKDLTQHEVAVLARCGVAYVGAHMLSGSMVERLDAHTKVEARESTARARANMLERRARMDQ